MGKDSPWRQNSLNCGSNLRPPEIVQQSTNSMVFPTYNNPFGCAFSIYATAPFSSRFAANNFLHQMHSSSIPPSNASGFSAAQKGFLVFDHSRDQTNLIYSSVGNSFLGLNPINPYDGSNACDPRVGEEMREDSEEIDALLYSESDNDSYEEEEEEEASTGHSPFETTTAGGSVDEVACSSHALAKRKRADASLTDTASSAAAFHHPNHGHVENDYDYTESSCVGGGDEEGDLGGHQSKRQRIRETVGVLRRIIPGGRGKDAAAVLDEAIRYLRSLKLKAKALGSGRSVATAS